MPLITPEFKEIDKSPLIPAMDKYNYLMQLLVMKEWDKNYQPEKWEPKFKRYFSSDLKNYTRDTIVYFRDVIKVLIEHDTDGLDEALTIIDESGAPIYDFVGCFYAGPIKVLTALAYDLVEYCLVTKGLSVGETKKILSNLGYPEIAIGLATVQFLENQYLV